ncbi:MAG: proteobacterial dedicated sortase system response regulator [Thiotrichales bacterium]|nr:proteobacterial dedicated sortase system response regulator [Thiotrichales bacterium]
MQRHIVLVEDEPAIRQNYADALLRQGYRVSTYDNSGDALNGLLRELPDMVILDIALGEDSEAGFELCRQLRASSERLPILFLTARDSDLDSISGLRLGADDYLTKDITLAHLSARIAALFRRIDALQTAGETRDDVIECDDLHINCGALLVEWKGSRIDLTLTEFWIVASLARRPGQVKNRDQLMQDANIFVDDGTVTSHIKRIRKKFREIDRTFDAIDTIYGMGYRWNHNS